ncbi:uncharacterized protein C2845_PM07G01620 [Panicum miliaceum]|uniref:Uncharacterized protein n=1 Tax=Panicum miliaceum TaxID=4540 RepID=A0A3L6SL05_PANMI|nr:uncharacterized protein C2845_PM07G01620 [Panicum miliaceum]
MRSGDGDGYDAVYLSPQRFLGEPDSPDVLAMVSRLYCLRGTAPSPAAGSSCSTSAPRPRLAMAAADTTICPASPRSRLRVEPHRRIDLRLQKIELLRLRVILRRCRIELCR